MSGGLVSVPVSASKPPAAERPRNPRTIPKTRTGRQADPRRGPHQGPGGASLPAPSIRSGQNPGYPRSLPKNGRQKPNNIRAWTSPAPLHPERTENRKLRQRPQTKGQGGEGGGGKKKGGGKAKKPEGREKPGNRKAGKQKSREASEGTKRHKKNGGAPSGAPPPAALSGALRIGITCCGKSSCSRR